MSITLFEILWYQYDTENGKTTWELTFLYFLTVTFLSIFKLRVYGGGGGGGRTSRIFAIEKRRLKKDFNSY